MTILLDLVAAAASRSTPRVEETPAAKLWANPARIVEVEFRVYCDWFVCNAHKGPNVGGIDPRAGRHARLFHPRKDQWRDHFKWRSEKLVGITTIGRATVVVLAMNRSSQLRARRALIWDGLFPPRKR
jgi:hypothetical protein